MNSSEEEEILIMSLLSEEEQKKGRKRRRFWVHNICKPRMIHGEFHALDPDLLEDETICFEYFRMTYGQCMTPEHVGTNLVKGKYIF
jgi:hypothetical protein